MKKHRSKVALRILKKTKARVISHFRDNVEFMRLSLDQIIGGDVVMSSEQLELFRLRYPKLVEGRDYDVESGYCECGVMNYWLIEVVEVEDLVRGVLWGEKCDAEVRRYATADVLDDLWWSYKYCKDHVAGHAYFRFLRKRLAIDCLACDDSGLDADEVGRRLKGEPAFPIVVC